MTDPKHRQVCAEAEPRMEVGEVVEIPDLLTHRLWTDDDGIEWRRRGEGDLAVKQARRLLAREDVLLMHVFLGAAHLHEGPDREGLVADIEQNLTSRNLDPMHTYDFGEFRDDNRRTMLMVVERC